MMIIGTGIDLIEIERISASHGRFGQRFLHKIYTPEELDYCMSHKFFEVHLAVRFAAKEAVAKAFGTGIGERIGWTDISILKKESGQPFVAYSEKGQRLCSLMGVEQTHISLTHAKTHAAAQAVLVGN